MSTESRPLPAQEFRLGAIKASVWENQSKGSSFFKTTFVHIYRVAEDQREAGDNGWRETTSFAADDLVLIRELARLASSWIREHSATAEKGVSSND